MNYDTIKRNFERGLWTASMVAMATEKGILTPEAYEAITGSVYTGPAPTPSEMAEFIDTLQEVIES
mgnify:CR=1 FL=1